MKIWDDNGACLSEEAGIVFQASEMGLTPFEAADWSGLDIKLVTELMDIFEGGNW